jgi:hypothetical protein
MAEKEEEIDFYKELEMMDHENINDTTCLISKSPLTENCIKLNCNHSFNYYPLFCEIYKQKYNLNSYLTKKLESGIFKCPYCRASHHSLLPYDPKCNDKVPLVYGINTDDLMFSVIKDNRTNKFVYSYTIYGFHGKCGASTVNDETSEISPCKHTYVFVHQETSKTYCSFHIHKAKQEYKKYKKEQEQKKIKEEKNKIKEEKNKIKEEEKKIKEEQKKIKEDNIILCSQILKTGKNKGKPCGCKSFKDSLCKKHAPKNILET